MIGGDAKKATDIFFRIKKNISLIYTQASRKYAKSCMQGYLDLYTGVSCRPMASSPVTFYVNDKRRA